MNIDELRSELFTNLQSLMVGAPSEKVFSTWLNDRHLVEFYKKWKDTKFEESYKPVIKAQYVTSMHSIVIDEFEVSIAGANVRSVYKTKVGEVYPCQIYVDYDDAWVMNPDVHHEDMLECMEGIIPKLGGYIWRERCAPGICKHIMTPLGFVYIVGAVLAGSILTAMFTY